VVITLHLVAECADFSNVCMSAVFICGSSCCIWNLYPSKYTSMFEELLSAVCFSLSTEAEILSAFLLLETAAHRPRTVAVVIDRVSADDARARRRAAGGALMTSAAASLPRGTANRRSVDARGRVINLSWRCAVLERF